MLVGLGSTFSGLWYPVFCRARIAVRNGYPFSVMVSSNSLSSWLRAIRSSAAESKKTPRGPLVVRTCLRSKDKWELFQFVLIINLWMNYLLPAVFDHWSCRGGSLLLEPGRTSRQWVLGELPAHRAQWALPLLAVFRPLCAGAGQLPPVLLRGTQSLSAVWGGIRPPSMWGITKVHVSESGHRVFGRSTPGPLSAVDSVKHTFRGGPFVLMRAFLFIRVR